MTVWGLDLLFHAVSIFAHSFHILGRYQKSGAPHKMRKFYTSTTTIERDSESEGSDSRPPEMLL